MIQARNTPIHKPINWMHRGSEDTKNENIGVMVNSRLVKGGLSSLKYFTDSDIENFTVGGSSETILGQTHIRQDGVIWAQYFPSYAKKIAKGIEDGSLYVSMECFFEDFDYILKDDDDSETFTVIKRDESSSHMSKALKGYGGKGKVNYKGQEYRIGRLLRNIVFSGQGIVKEPANIKDGKILSIIINDESSFAGDAIAQNGGGSPPPEMPSVDPTQTSDPMSMEGGQPEAPKDPRDLPTTYVAPEKYLYNTPQEAQYVAENVMGCTGYHVYLENRHSENPFLFAALLGDPTDIEKQSMRPKYLPCDYHKEFLLLSGMEGQVGDESGGGADTRTNCSENADVCLTITDMGLDYSSSAPIKSFVLAHNGCIISGSGGDAEANGLSIQVTESSLTAVAPEGGSIPAGSGTLILLGGETTQECITGLSFSDPEDNRLEAEFAQGATIPTQQRNQQPSPGGGNGVAPKPGTMQPVNVFSKAAWEDLKNKIKNRNSPELDDKKQYGYNNHDNQEGNQMTDTNDYKKMYMKVSKELSSLKKIEANKKVTDLQNEKANLEKDLASACEIIEASADVIEEMDSMNSELSELREFVSQADSVIAELELSSLGSKRLEALNSLVGDTYSSDDIPTLANMSEEAYDHLYASMNKVVTKIEEAAASVESSIEDAAKAEEVSEEKRMLEAIRAVETHKPSPQGDLVVKAARKDKMSAARNLISNALRR